MQRRNSLKLHVRDAGPELFKKIAEYRNQNKYGNPIGPTYQTSLRQGCVQGVYRLKSIDEIIIAGSKDTSGLFNASGSALKAVGVVGEVVGFVLMASQNSPDSLSLCRRVTMIRSRLRRPALSTAFLTLQTLILMATSRSRRISR